MTYGRSRLRALLGRPALAGALVLGGLLATPGMAGARGMRTCSGTPEHPGVLAGNYDGNVRVEGACVVNAGIAQIAGDLTIGRGSAVLAAFGRNDSTGAGNSSLRVMGSIRVLGGGTLIMGCLPSSFPCFDDPSHDHPTLSSDGKVGGSIIEIDPLGVIVHNSSIGANVRESGGGGGTRCDPSGIFAAFGSPVYSDYEDTTIGGSLRISGLHSCWLGVARVGIAHSARFVGNQLADPDAIEIINNHIGGDLACMDNSRVWDSADISSTGSLYPRQPEPNTVGGARRGQCVLASPATDSSPPGPGEF